MRDIVSVLENYNIKGEVVNQIEGPLLDIIEFSPIAGTKLKNITTKKLIMIQRLQTLLLLIAAICFATACFMPLGTITTFDMQYLFTPWTIKLNIADGQIIRYTYYIGIMQVVLAIWSLITIFMYKKRPLQSKMCLAMLFLNLILFLLI